jgi:uncharacterized RDD family membrane protein YckC
MEVIDSATTQGTSIPAPVHYAGFLLRFVAHLIDRLIMGFVTFVVIVPVLAIFGISFFGMRSMNEWQNMDDLDPGTEIAMVIAFIGAYASLFLISIALNWLYYSLMESSQRQATVGKLALGIKVTDMNGNRISFLNATGRYFGKIISGAIFMIGYIMIIFTEKKQGLHDIMAGTLVVRK